MKIAVDFDGTIVEHCFPEIGPPVPGAIQWLKRIEDAGGELLLWTVRSGRYLQEALGYCYGQGIALHGINESPGQSDWSTSPKIYAPVYIDDAAFGCPLIRGTVGDLPRPMVDWSIVGPAIYEMVIAERACP